MKISNKIIGLTITISIVLTCLSPGLAKAVDERPPTEPEQACQTKKPNFNTLLTAWQQENPKTLSSYENAFEDAQEAYHDYIGCLFDYAESVILRKPLSTTLGTWVTSTPNIDWMDPPVACISNEEIKQVILDTDYTQMLTPALEMYGQYKEHLTKVYNLYSNSTVERQRLKDKAEGAKAIKRRNEMEITNALVALDMMFTSLKELRLAFVIHVRFQCTLKYLERYRKVLEEIRIIVEALPGKLRDASISK